TSDEMESRNREAHFSHRLVWDASRPIQVSLSAQWQPVLPSLVWPSDLEDGLRGSPIRALSANQARPSPTVPGASHFASGLLFHATTKKEEAEVPTHRNTPATGAKDPQGPETLRVQPAGHSPAHATAMPLSELKRTADEATSGTGSLNRAG